MGPWDAHGQGGLLPAEARMALDLAPFTVAVPEQTLVDLERRLRATRWPGRIPGSGWQYGVDSGYLGSLVQYWLSDFDWREQERQINRFTHQLAKIDGRRVHFIHERASAPGALPIVVTHGWPGSFLEMIDLIPRLAHPERFGGSEKDSFHVIVPSIPGYGFSDPPKEPGMDPEAIAVIWVRLMQGLGYDRFAAQGGDWGASIATRLGLRYPEHIVGIHLNYIPGSYLPYQGPEERAPSEYELAFLESASDWYERHGGYAHVQETRPDTLAYALNDSPVGLLAWIFEKLRDWSDCDGNIESRFSKDVVLTHVMLYWVTQTIAPANRIYYEAVRNPIHLTRGQRVEVPCAVASFPKEEPNAPREWIERGYNLQRFTELPRGGHFAAMEEPALLARDIQEFFRCLREAQG